MAAELALLERWLGLRGRAAAGAGRRGPVLQTLDGPSLEGLSTIAAHLVRQANQEHLLGSTAEEQALVQQWMECRVTRLRDHASREDVRALLKVELTVQEKEKYLNVSRWFCHVQHCPGLRQSLPAVVFVRNRLYAPVH
ncbi:eukaryotic translation elongation factor 1 epsilon-1 isoform X2 [Sorex araneus]|uniref:eukaryotic translation elongation factor 1 epsilon-1 isoform X2 n=1 Tax=Sorex araneus TaxID=42254 RepID=UPI002433E5BF|nr:eukaryotic translation elongation factor 1 epsilon-1 isoform X2 [Sorex araneus]